jgi:glutathione peroxidase
LEERSQRGIPEKPHEVEQTELQGEDAYHSIDSLRLSSLLTQMLSVFLMTSWIAQSCGIQDHLYESLVSVKSQRRMSMNKGMILALTLLIMGGLTAIQAGDNPPKGSKTPSIYDFKLKDIEGKDVKLDQFRGKALLLVNVASQCGYTPQYEGLQKIHSKYKDQGFAVLGFPANNFGAQEPGTDQEIKTFCSTKYHVKFPMFSKISVKGSDQHPLYKFLTDEKTDPKFAGEITWNFNKFLVDKTGNIVGRFDSKDTPEGEKVVKAIEQALKP